MEIEGFENYLIFENGDIVNVNTGLKLKTSKDKKGYSRIRLSKNGKKSNKSVHRLLAQAFIPNPDNKPQVDHINRITDDNRLKNLRWVTHSQNQINRKIMCNSKSKIKNIRFHYGSFEINIKRNGERYQKRKKTLEEAIKQRDLMLSMWTEIR